MKGKTVLIVDDDRSFVEALALLLERRGYRALRTFGGEEGFLRLRDEDVDLGIIDMHLPDLSGIEIVRRMRVAGNRTPVVLISGDHRPDIRQASAESGASLFLPKPLDPEQLLDVIAQALKDSG
jgi:DNA-binding response OmpR family regulator